MLRCGADRYCSIRQSAVLIKDEEEYPQSLRVDAADLHQHLLSLKTLSLTIASITEFSKACSPSQLSHSPQVSHAL